MFDYFQESLIILLLAPVILAISSILLASFSAPTLLLRGLLDWSERYLAREEEMALLATSQLHHHQGEMADTDNQSPRFIF